jgi:hypothetical protein
MTHDKQRTVRDKDGKNRYTNTQQQNTAQWSKISTQLKNGHKQKNVAWIFRTTAENTVGTTRTAHSKHSKRFYALFLRFANSSTAKTRYEQRVGRFKALSACGILTTTTSTAAVNTYEQEIRKNCSNTVSL